MMRLNHLEALVHHARAIDGDLRAHLPCGVTQRLSARRTLDIALLPCAERPARRGQYQPRYGIAALRLKTLEDRRMLAVHRHDGLMKRRRLSHDQRAAGHQRFLVGQQQPPGHVQRRHRRRKPRDAYDRRQYVVGLRRQHRLPHRVLAEIPLAEAHVLGQFVRLCGQRRHGGTKFAHQLKQRLRAGVRRQKRYPELIGHAPRNVQRLPSDGAGRPQYGQRPHSAAPINSPL